MCITHYTVPVCGWKPKGDFINRSGKVTNRTVLQEILFHENDLITMCISTRRINSDYILHVWRLYMNYMYIYISYII